MIRALLNRWLDWLARSRAQAAADHADGRRDALAGLPARRSGGWDYRRGYAAGLKERA